MRKITSLVSAFAAVSTMLTMVATADAATSVSASHPVTANQSLLNQIDKLDKQLSQEHKNTLRNEVKKDLETYRADLVKEQSARMKLEVAISTYEKTVKQNKGHDHGTIVKTASSAERILNNVKKSLETDQSLIQRDIQQTKSDINKGRLQLAVNEAKKADARVVELTSSFNAAAKGLNQITNKITGSTTTGSTTTGSTTTDSTTTDSTTTGSTTTGSTTTGSTTNS